jgi:hypothetical protein
MGDRDRLERLIGITGMLTLAPDGTITLLSVPPSPVAVRASLIRPVQTVPRSPPLAACRTELSSFESCLYIQQNQYFN